MSIQYTPRSGTATKVEGYALAIPGTGLVLSYSVPELDKFCQDILGTSSPLIKSEVDLTQEGAPLSMDTFAEVATALDTKLTAVQAVGVSGMDPSADFVLVAPVAASLSGSYDNVEVQNALDAKADHVALSGFLGECEVRMDAAEAKINDLIAALKTAGVLALQK